MMSTRITGHSSSLTIGTETFNPHEPNLRYSTVGEDMCVVEEEQA